MCIRDSGGIRALYQMVSFEIPLILSLLGIVMLTGTLSLVGIVESQVNFPWIIFMPIGAVVFFICILADLKEYHLICQKQKVKLWQVG